MVGPLQRKQRQQGAEQIREWAFNLLQAEGIEPVSVVWDLGQLDLDKEEHTLNIITESGIVKASFTARELEDSFSYVHTPQVDELREALGRLREQTGQPPVGEA
ncbi:hypothetical protein SAMN05660831_00887 [Thiohalospira halophila DSM 15071]|uniref:Uncharacterized protein n=1 Tax=Thiohalospira halophila DSM 15071 TaxID=1123397 RepID=A0A1I1Q6Z1_9GAMM|nr:hypothetical protein [Thiohalospira halophila]SFD14993.1 hypothetical protein SAMN05660831_00887 [Thiohalospira halophila DSM 15071]